MSFVAWAALAVGVLAVAPFIAHLLRRRPPDEERFAATKWVPANPAVAQRRTALEDRALLAIRVAAVVALAVLGATPFISCSRLSLSRDAGASVALAIVLDDSMSMQVTLEPDSGSALTRFARAKSAAVELVAGLKPGDAVAIVLVGEPVRVALAASTNLDAARVTLDRVSQTDRGSDLDGAVSIAGELLSGLEHVDKRVVVLSDLARSGGSENALKVRSGVELWVPLQQLQGARRNCGVVQADRSDRQIVARVACGAVEPGEGDEQPRKLAVKAGAEVLVEAPLRLQQGAADVVLKLPEQGADDAEARLYVELIGAADAIRVDDAAPVVAVGGQLRVGVVTDPASSDLATGGPPAVEQAFKALSLGVQVRPLSAVPDRAEELDVFELLIVDDMPGFTPAQRRELARWVDDGGVLLITLGPGAAAAPLGSSFAPMLKAIVRWTKDTSAGVDPASDNLFGQASSGLDILAAKGRAALDLERDTAPQIISRWSDGAPFALETRMGRGRAYVLTLPFDTEISDLALRPGFLHLLQRLTVAARTLGGVARTTVGHPWTVEGFEQVEVSRVDRRDQATPLAVKAMPGSQTRHAVADRLGLYELKLDGHQSTRVAAMSEAEVDMVPRALPAGYDGESFGGETASVDVSAYVAVFLIGLMLVELLLRVLSPRVRPRDGDAPPSSGAAPSSGSSAALSSTPS